ncbi:hypothetical protein ACHAXS_002106 [Conticribra weissflogii]
MLKRDDNNEVRGKRSTLRKRLSLIVDKENRVRLHSVFLHLACLSKNILIKRFPVHNAPRPPQQKNPMWQLVDVGDVAPDFELVDCEGIKHKLSDFRGRRVLLSFFRFAS